MTNILLEVHYAGAREQDASIRRVLRERRRPVYAMGHMSGAILVQDGKIELIGKVRKFDP